MKIYLNKKNYHHVGDKMYEMTTNENRLYLKRKKKDPVNSIHGTEMESQTLLVITQIKCFLQMTSFKM